MSEDNKLINKYKKILISIVVLILLLVLATFISFSKFNVANSFAVANGLFQVILTNKQYAEIQEYPNVILAKPDVSLKSYMEGQGYTENAEEQLGAVRVFEQAEHQQCVVLSVNKYFAKWHWNE